MSGGQKQTSSIRQEHHKKPEYSLDDSFSALDYQTDARFKRAFKGLKLKMRPVLIVAQRIVLLGMLIK